MRATSRRGVIRTSALCEADRLSQDRRLALRLVPVSRETEERLAVFVTLLARWRKATNLISESTFPSVWTRHIADSAQLLPLAQGASRWLDMGSGAGFPGLIVAIELADAPGAVVHCVDSDQRRCAFLREAARATGASAVIHPVRVESLDPADIGPVDCVTARAFAPLSKTLEFAKPWLESGAVGLFPRGRSATKDLEQDPPPQRYAIETIRSVIDADAAILRVRMN
jgi:16S rRNA (guanine527-N7)-methyltransferase